MTIFRFERPCHQRCTSQASAVAILLATLLMAGCSGSAEPQVELACESSPRLKLSDLELIAIDSRERALFGIEQTRKVEGKAKSAWFGTGALSDTLGRIGGTEAISVRAEARKLETMVANQKAVDLALSMGGNNQLPANASWACEKLAVSVASLDTRQSDEQFLQSLGQVEAYFRSVYELNGGQNIDEALAESAVTGNVQ